MSVAKRMIEEELERAAWLNPRFMAQLTEAADALIEANKQYRAGMLSDDDMAEACRVAVVRINQIAAKADDWEAPDPN